MSLAAYKRSKKIDNFPAWIQNHSSIYQHYIKGFNNLKSHEHLVYMQKHIHYIN